jgi:hypothetical protein
MKPRTPMSSPRFIDDAADMAGRYAAAIRARKGGGR